MENQNTAPQAQDAQDQVRIKKVNKFFLSLIGVFASIILLVGIVHIPSASSEDEDREAMKQEIANIKDQIQYNKFRWEEMEEQQKDLNEDNNELRNSCNELSKKLWGTQDCLIDPVKKNSVIQPQ